MFCTLFDLRRKNPYCLTDRYFDELSLVTNTKIKLADQRKEKAQLEFHCKVRGRYSSDIRPKQFFGFNLRPSIPRLTQGTILLVREGNGIPIWKRRVVIASFQAYNKVNKTIEMNTIKTQSSKHLKTQ